MAYVKYPWHRFQVWLNQQPEKALAGIRSTSDDYYDSLQFMTDNVISRFLADKVGPQTKHWRLSFCFIFIDHSHTHPVNVMPEWAGRLLALIDIEKEGGRYQFRTVKRLLQQVKEEYWGHETT